MIISVNDKRFNALLLGAIVVGCGLYYWFKSGGDKSPTQPSSIESVATCHKDS